MAKNEATLLIRIKEVGAEILDRLVITIEDVINVLKSIPAAVMATIDAFREEQAAVNQLTQSMINQGVFTGELRKEYIQLASALQDVTLFADEQIINAAAIMQSYLGQTKVTKELMSATLDLAERKKMDLASAAEMVGKTIGTETNALAKSGLQLDENATKTEKLAQTIAFLDRKMGGAAETAAKDLGVMDQLKNTWSDFLEKIGGMLGPFATSLAKTTNEVLKFFTSMLPTSFDASKASVSDFTAEILKLNKKLIELKDRQEKVQASGGIDQGLTAMITSLQQQVDAHRDARAKIIQQEKDSAAEKEALDAETRQKEVERRLGESEQDLQALVVKEEIKKQTEIGIELQKQNAIIASNASAAERLKAIRTKQALEKKITDAMELKSEEEKNKLMAKNREETLSTISTLQHSHNKLLAAAGKAAAITQIAIETPVAIAKALSAFPPPFNFIAAGLVGVAMGAQAARIAGVQLAEGGIVKSTPGGVPAIIGEGGRDEAVIPLDDPSAQERLGGKGTTIVFNGPVLGDEAQAMEFARAVDRGLFKLRQSNQSVAFETDTF